MCPLRQLSRGEPGHSRLLGQVQGRIHVVDVPLIQTLPQKLHGFAEALEVDDLALAQEADGVVDVRVVGDTQDIVIRYARLLLCCNCENATFCIYICGKFQKFQ